MNVWVLVVPDYFSVTVWTTERKAKAKQEEYARDGIIGHVVQTTMNKEQDSGEE